MRQQQQGNIMMLRVMFASFVGLLLYANMQTGRYKPPIRVDSYDSNNNDYTKDNILLHSQRITEEQKADYGRTFTAPKTYNQRIVEEEDYAADGEEDDDDEEEDEDEEFMFLSGDEEELLPEEEEILAEEELEQEEAYKEYVQHQKKIASKVTGATEKEKKKLQAEQLTEEKKALQAARLSVEKHDDSLHEDLEEADADFRKELYQKRGQSHADQHHSLRAKENDEKEAKQLREKLAKNEKESERAAQTKQKQKEPKNIAIAEEEPENQNESAETLLDESVSNIKKLKSLKHTKAPDLDSSALDESTAKQMDRTTEAGTDKIPLKTKYAVHTDAEHTSFKELVIEPLPWKGKCPKLAWPEPPQETPAELARIWNITKPYCNETASALFTRGYFAGYRNQIMSFSGLVMWSLLDGHKQILLETINHKDTYGTNKRSPHEALFDVEHWNSYYPKLPRMVHCDPNIMIDYNCSANGKGSFGWPIHNMPHHYKTFKNEHFVSYSRYTRKKGPLAEPFPNQADILIKSGALRPHPEMRAHAKKLFKTMGVKEDDYMALHARIEPDMQKHPVCREKKVLNLTSIVQFLETTWKHPPVSAVFMPINRQYLEKEGLEENYKKGEEINWIAVNNLKELNRLSNEGLWGGKAKIFEFGSNALEGTKYAERMWSIGGSILNFDIATNAKFFVGTEISSFSNDLVATRFYRGNFENYFYRPDGLHRVTNASSAEPPGFGC